MKRIFARDKKNRKIIKQFEFDHFVWKQILTNSNILKTTRWNSLHLFSNISKKSFKTTLLKRCIQTKNKKTFHKFSNFSRIIFLKLIRSGYISGMRKASW